MASHRGITVAVALMFGLPIITLIATAYQMVGTGGDGLILPAKVAQPPAVAAPQASGAAAPAGQATPSGA
ncbi:MAG: cytochrome c4, partial [Bordetella sp.]|nr:cytochrome c4 [Bordetella sp.]